MKKLILLSALLIFACSSDDSNNNDNNNSGLLNCDGNPIPSIVYGSQEWTVENACHITYRDGTPIPQVTDDAEWVSLTTGAWCYYDNDPSKHRLYNWFAVMGIHDTDPNTPNKEFAPSSWHLPSVVEWTTLINYLIANGYTEISTAMSSNTGWDIGLNDQSLNNSSGFNAFPEGVRDHNAGEFWGEGFEWLFWTSTDEYTSLNGDFGARGIYAYGGPPYDVEIYDDDKRDGFSVRLVKD